MLKVLLNKQIMEVFKGYFYDSKKNKMRSKWAIAGWFIFFIVIMVGLLGGIFTGLAMTLCKGLLQFEMGWLYFLIMGSISIILGAFGSVFNTYSGLYLSKDNDLLLSMPIPVRTIITARLLNVYLMGTMYVAAVFLPTLIVYWIEAGLSAARLICGLLQFLIITAFVLFLSCCLGWVVAKISLKLKNKSLITVLISLLFIGGYYFFYFKSSNLIRDVVMNAVLYREKIKGSAFVLYLFGRIGEGDWAAATVFTAATAALFAILCFVLTRSFLSIATSSGNTEKVRYVKKMVKEKSLFGALLNKEFSRFFSSPNYMLNCGMGILLIPACGVLLLIKGSMILEVLNDVFSKIAGTAEILLCAMICGIASMNDMAAPSISLEGKSLWILKSLPVSQKIILRAKMALQLILTAPFVLFAGICTSIITPASASIKLLICIVPFFFTLFNSVFGTFLGIKMPIFNWNDEIAPIKQSASVTIALFGSWGIVVIFAGLYMWVGHKIGSVGYLTLWTVLFAFAACLLLRWLDTKGSSRFTEL